MCARGDLAGFGSLLADGMECYTGFHQGEGDDGVGGDILWIIPGVKALQAYESFCRRASDVLEHGIFVSFQEVAHYIYICPQRMFE